MADPDRTVLTESDITDPGPLRTALNNAGESGAPVAWGDVTGKPVNFPPSGHAATHATGGSDPITPASIGAVGDDDPRLLDTGWRLLSPENGWTGEIRLRRFGSIVHFRARDLNGVASNSSNVILLPSGFHPGPNMPAHGMGNKSSNAASGSDPIGAVGGGNNQLVRTFGTTASWVGGSASIEWMTSDAFPTTLPGTPA